jgi:hypothetical protein
MDQRPRECPVRSAERRAELLFGLFILRTLLKHDWLAAVGAALVGIWLESSIFGSENLVLAAAIMFVTYFILFLILLRFGLLASIAAVFFFNSFQSIVLGFDWNTWYSPYGIAALVFLLGIAIFAFWRSLGTQNLFGGDPA